jgi:hypothetical protein
MIVRVGVVVMVGCGKGVKVIVEIMVSVGVDVLIGCED